LAEVCWGIIISLQTISVDYCRGGGSDGYRIKFLKYQLHKSPNINNMPTYACHFPPCASKWNKVEHKLFSFISPDLKGQPLRDFETVVKHINHTDSSTGLNVICRLNRRKYKLGIGIPKEQMNSISLKQNKFHREWNFKIFN
jgi:hypothetical protein